MTDTQRTSLCFLVPTENNLGKLREEVRSDDMKDWARSRLNTKNNQLDCSSLKLITSTAVSNTEASLIEDVLELTELYRDPLFIG